MRSLSRHHRIVTWPLALVQARLAIFQLLACRTCFLTVLKDDEVEKLVLLRMKKKFMKFMRKNYAHLSRQQFNMTVVPP